MREPGGTGYTIVWTIANDFNETETGSVISVTGGLSTLSSTTYSIAASPGQPYSSTTLTQTLPPSASGLITLDISSTWSDGFSTTDAGTYDLSQLNCGAPDPDHRRPHLFVPQRQPDHHGGIGWDRGGERADDRVGDPQPAGPDQGRRRRLHDDGHRTVGLQLVVCGGSSTPNGSGSSGDRVGHRAERWGRRGHLLRGPDPGDPDHRRPHLFVPERQPDHHGGIGWDRRGERADDRVGDPQPAGPDGGERRRLHDDGHRTVGLQLVVCGGSSTPNGSGSSATESVTVPSGGAGVGIFYVVQAPVTQTIAGHIYLCQSSARPPRRNRAGPRGERADDVSATPNPLAPTGVSAGGYTMTATAPSGFTLVVCGGSSTPNGSGSTATESVTVPSGGAGVGIFYVVATSPVTSPTATTTGSGGGAGSSGGSSPATPATNLSTTPPAATASAPPASTSTLAYTGAPLSWEWLLGLALVLLGSVLLALGRWRRLVSGEGWLGFVGLP